MTPKFNNLASLLMEMGGRGSGDPDLGKKRAGNRPPAAPRTGDERNRLGGTFNLTDDGAFVYWSIFPLPGDEPLDADLTHYMGVMQSSKVVSGKKIRSLPSILALLLVRFGHKYEANFKQFIPTINVQQPGMQLTLVSTQDSPTVDEEERATVDRWIETERLFSSASGVLDALLQFANYMGLDTRFKEFVVQEVMAEGKR